MLSALTLRLDFGRVVNFWKDDLVLISSIWDRTVFAKKVSQTTRIN